jgi:ABC-2 type transport system permease protein
MHAQSYGGGMNAPVLLRPGRVGAMRHIVDRDGPKWGRIIAGLGFGFVVTAIVFYLTLRGLRFVANVEIIGILLAGRLLEWTLLAVSAFVLLSSLATALSTFYLADDLSLIRAAPVPEADFFMARWLQTGMLSAWMAVGFSMPILGAYGYAFGGGWRFALTLLAAIPPLVLIPTAAAVMVISVLVCIFPARRVRELFLVLGVLSAAILLLLFRVARPERLFRPEVFGDVASYVTAFELPQAALLPSTWAAEALQSTVLAGELGWLPIGLLWSALWAIGGAAYLLHYRLYGLAYSRAQEGGAGYFKKGRWAEAIIEWVTRPLPRQQRAFARKDALVFIRDPGQWSQLLLLLILIVAYVYNYAANPGIHMKIGQIEVNHLLAVLNLVLAGFVLAALCARFAFPAVSVEGRAFWLVRTAPLPARRFLWLKFRIGVLPLIFLGALLAGITAYWLDIGPMLIAVSIFHTVVVTVVLTAMGIGLGALYPRFKFENPAQVPMSFGGIMFMLAATLYSFLAALGTAWIAAPLAVPSISRSPLVWVISLLIWLTFHGLHATIPLRSGSRALASKEYD